jgi:hypothetical protein
MQQKVEQLEKAQKKKLSVQNQFLDKVKERNQQVAKKCAQIKESNQLKQVSEQKRMRRDLQDVQKQL